MIYRVGDLLAPKTKSGNPSIFLVTKIHKYKYLPLKMIVETNLEGINYEDKLTAKQVEFFKEHYRTIGNLYEDIHTLLEGL